MKKTLIIILIVLGLIIIVLAGTLINRRFAENEAKKPNMEFETILSKEMYGTDVVTIINKAMNNNRKYEIPTDEEGDYIANDTNSIKVEIVFVGIEESYSMEKICKVGLEEFMRGI